MPAPIDARPVVALVSRRTCLALAGGLGASALVGLGGCATWAAGMTWAQRWVPPLDDPQAYRLTNRLTWGATDAAWQEARQDPNAFIAAQLLPSGPDGLPDPLPALIAGLQISREPMVDIVRAQQAEGRRIAALSSPDERVAAQQAAGRLREQLRREATARHWWRALYGRHQLREQLSWFWLNHFSVHAAKAGIAQTADFEERAIRPHALGRFRTLLGAAVKHPAMLAYLDNQANAANRSNENLARELLELHTLGVDGGYGQADVQALARVLTGHAVSYRPDPPKLREDQVALYRREGAYEFNPARHDFGDKTLLGAPVPGRGADELEAVLDRLAAHPATARFVCGKLALFLLGEPPPPEVARRMAETYLAQQGDIARTLAVLVTDPVFWRARPDSFKDPMRFVVSSLRAAYRADQVVINTRLPDAWLARLGQPLYGRLTPDGWPLQAEAWTGSGQLATRFDIARELIRGSGGLFTSDRAVQTPAVDMAMGMASGSMSAPGSAPVVSAAAPVRPAVATVRPRVELPLFEDALQGQLTEATRNALAAASALDRDTLALASPEFMQR